MDGAPKLDRVMDGRAWNDFCERLKRAGRLVIDAAPDDAFDRAEGLRYVGRIARHALDNFIERSDPAAPVVGGLPKLGGDNPDYLYASAPLSADHEYRIVGNLGEARYVGIGSYDGEVGSDEGLALCGYLATPELETDAAGNFEIVVSQQEQPGNWLRTGPATTQLMTRQTLLDRRHQRPATFEIERTDGAGGSRPLDPARYLQQLDRAGLYVEGAIGQFLAWTRSFARSPNQIRVVDPELAAGAQGDPSTHYYGGYYELDADEALVVELVPPKCEYWNLQLCNHWLESLDYEHHDVHVNDQSAVFAGDGAVRVVVADRDPGVANWLDCAGHRRGGMFLRWVGTTEPMDPVCRVVAIDQLSAGAV
jgi:hypothetical protein